MDAGQREPKSFDRDEYLVSLHAKLTKLVTRICPPWLQDSREDIIQAGLVRVIEILDKNEGNRQFNTSYLWKVAYCAVVDEIRRQRRARVVALDEGQEMVMDNDQPNPERDTFGGEIGAEIYRCLGQLIERRRVAAMLHLQGHTVDQVAHLLGLKSKQAENLVYRGMQQLRECLKRKGLEP